jgi:transposase-like protein
MKRRRFTREFKLEILRELEGKTLAQVCREHDLVPNVASRWRKEFESNPHQAFSGNGKLWKEDAKIVQYERLIGRLYAEVDFLKKTLDALQRRKAEEKRLLR